MDDDIGDDLLRLIFTACHPVLSTEARVALTLRLLGGLTTGEIARAFLVPEPTIAQRIVRAKKTLAKANVRFEVPRGVERQERLASVLDVIYLVFNEGYSATAGEDWVRPSLCEEALRLGRALAELAAGEPEVHGLVALMELQSSRLRARLGPHGEPVRLLDQNRARWDRLLIGRGLTALRRADRLTREPGSYHLQAAIAACHARATVPEETDWTRIADLYVTLIAATGSPIVRLNHAVAVGMADGPAAGLALVDALLAEGSLDDLSLCAERARRFAREAREACGGARRVREGRGTDEERARTGVAASPRAGVRSVAKMKAARRQSLPQVSACVRIDRSIASRMMPLPGRTRRQYQRNRRRLSASAHWTRVSVVSLQSAPSPGTTMKFQAARAVPAGCGPRNVVASTARSPPVGVQNVPTSPIRSSRGGSSARIVNPRSSNARSVIGRPSRRAASRTAPGRRRKIEGSMRRARSSRTTGEKARSAWAMAAYTARGDARTRVSCRSTTS